MIRGVAQFAERIMIGTSWVPWDGGDGGYGTTGRIGP